MFGRLNEYFALRDIENAIREQTEQIKINAMTPEEKHFYFQVKHRASMLRMEYERKSRSL